jgi:hypothetical protein
MLCHDVPWVRRDVVTYTKSTEFVLRSVRARQQFWMEERDRARITHNDQAAGDAQRLIDEYDAFIDILKHQSSGRALNSYRQTRR